MKVGDLTAKNQGEVFILRRSDVVTLDSGGVKRYRISRESKIALLRSDVELSDLVLGCYEPRNGSVSAHFFVRRCGDGTIPLGAWVVIE